jgi:hypothetical protein
MWEVEQRCIFLELFGVDLGNAFDQVIVAKSKVHIGFNVGTKILFCVGK